MAPTASERHPTVRIATAYEVVMSQPEHVIIARLAGDVCTKSSATRRTFHKRLKSNLKDALNRAHTNYTFSLNQARIDIVGDDPELLELASRVYGLASVTRGRRYAWTNLDDIVELGVREFGDAVRNRRFAVRTRRSGDSTGIPFKSPDVDRALGAALLPNSAGVDLDSPEVVARLDIRPDDVVFYETPRDAPGGLPLGVEGRALALISGGFDSAVAAFEIMSRGVELDFLFFNLGGPAHEQGVIDVLRQFTDRWCYGSRPVLHSVDFRPVVGEIQAKTKPRFWQVLLKRLFLRAATSIANAEGYEALVTGDALGQVSSQTLANLRAISAPIESLVLRPLVGFDKDDIIQKSRFIGTHDLSAHNPEYCALAAGRPATRASSGQLDALEEAVDMRVLDAQVAARRSERVDRLSDTVQIDVRVHRIEDGDVVLDLRDAVGSGEWSYDGAVHFPFARAMQAALQLPKEPRYVLFCDVGLKSAFLAEQMALNGYRAVSFAGGLAALKRWTK